MYNFDYITTVEEANKELAKLPKKIEGSLSLDGLTSAKGLNLPDKIGGWLYLNGLTSAKGLNLPDEIGRWLFLNGLTSAEKNKLRKKYPNINIY